MSFRDSRKQAPGERPQKHATQWPEARLGQRRDALQHAGKASICERRRRVRLAERRRYFLFTWQELATDRGVLAVRRGLS